MLCIDLTAAFNGAFRIVLPGGRRDVSNYPYRVRWNRQRPRRSVVSEVELQMPELDMNAEFSDSSDNESFYSFESEDQEQDARLWKSWRDIIRDPGTYYYIAAIGVVVYCALKHKK